MSVRDNRKGKNKFPKHSVEQLNYAAIAQHSVNAANVTITTNTSGEVDMKNTPVVPVIEETNVVEVEVTKATSVVEEAPATEEPETLVNENILTIKLWLETLHIDFKPMAGTTLLGLTGEQIVNMFSLPPIIPGIVINAALEEAGGVEQLAPHLDKVKMVAKLADIGDGTDAVDVAKVLDLAMGIAKPVIVEKLLPLWSNISTIINTFIGGEETSELATDTTLEVIPKAVVAATSALAKTKAGDDKRVPVDPLHVPAAVNILDLNAARKPPVVNVKPIVKPEETGLRLGDLFNETQVWGSRTLGY